MKTIWPLRLVMASAACAIAFSGRSVTRAAAPDGGAVYTTPIRSDVLAVRLVPLESTVERGKLIPALVGIKNTSDKRVLFSFDLPPWSWVGANEWIHLVTYRADRGSPRFGVGGAAGRLVSTSHAPPPGTPICAKPASIFALEPGAELLRRADLALDELPLGYVHVAVEMRLLAVSVDVRCAAPALHAGRAEARVQVVKPRR